MLLFSMTVFIASILPGPSMLLALTHGMQYGARRTLASAMGNLTVTLIQATVSIAGLGTILMTSGAVYQAIKWAGAAYLLYLGVNLLFSNISLPTESTHSPCRKKTLRGMFLQAAFVTAGNPKAIVFFTAIFPQFMDTESGFLPQYFLLMGIGALIAFSCFMLYATAGQKIVSLFTTANTGKCIWRIIGGTFIGTGICLAVKK